MRIRIVRRPSVENIDGVSLERFEPAREYDVGNSLGAVMLAEGWAEPVTAEPKPPGAREPRPSETPASPPNLIRQRHPHADDLPFAADRPRRDKNK